MELLLQLITVVCLVVVIFLLSIDKVKIVRSAKDEKTMSVPQIPDIIGKPESKEKALSKGNAFRRNTVRDLPIAFSASNGFHQVSASIDDAEITDLATLADQEELPYDDRFSNAISLEELTKARDLLQKNSLEHQHEQDAIEILGKIQGTELFSLMENSVENASQKIAKLLAKRFTESQESRSDDWAGDHFNIDDFI